VTGPGVFGVLGLDADEEAVYRALVDRPSATVGEIARMLRRPADAVARSLVLLEERGLAAASGASWAAASPAIALAPLVTQRRDELRRAELELLGLTERYRGAAGARTAGDLIEVVTGISTVARRFAQLQRGASRELLAFVTSRTVAVSRHDNVAEDEGVRRGVAYRIVLERAVLEEQGASADAVSAIRAGEEVRVVERLPIKLAVADRTLAMLPLDGGPVPAAVLVHRSGLLDGLVALFEAVWERAWPLRADLRTDLAGQALDETDQSVLTLLLAGLTDRAIASQLKLSMRTVQRRVRVIMDIAGVRTRLQLGAHATRAGWIR
jgi:sugar-specific transcriptional regulator TrmB